MARFLLIFLWIIFLNLSCKVDTREYIRIPDSSFSILSHSHLKDSVIRRNRQIESLKEFAKLMKLHTMNELEGQNCIRMWVWNWMPDSIYVSDIHYGTTKNTFSIIQFGSFKKGAVEYIQIHNRFGNLKPKLGWDSLLLAIKKYQIVMLPAGIKHTGLTHMTPVQFEVVESGKYRFYQFYEPSYYRMVDSNANKVHSFLTNLNIQAGIEFFKYDPNFVYDY
jgi:hypothetical protein